MTQQVPTFPLIQIITRDSIIYGFDNQSEYEKCDVSLVDRYVGSIVIDPKGQIFQIDRAERIRWGTWMLGYHPLMKGRSVILRFHYNKTCKCEWTEFTELISERLRQPHDSKLYPNSAKVILKRLEESRNFREIIELFIYDS